MKENKLAELSLEFSVDIINLVKILKSKRESIISNQIGRSGTSIGANIREAHYAHGTADFISKMQIALKECYETEFWFELFVKSELATENEVKNLYNQCGTVRRILVSSINTAKQDMK